MNRKSIYSLILSVALVVSFAFPVYADLASDSDADYFTESLLRYDNSSVLAVSQISPLTALVNGSWISLNYGDSSQSWVTVPANCTQIAWESRPDSLGDYRILKLDPGVYDTRFSTCNVRLVGSSTVYTDDDFFTHLNDDGCYYFSVFSSVSSTIHFNISSGTSFRLYFNTFYPTASNYKPVTVGGVYTSSDKPFTISTITVDTRPLYPLGIMYHQGRWYNYYFPAGGLLKRGYEYSFMFYAGNNDYSGTLRYKSVNISLAQGVRSGNYMSFTFTPDRDIRTDELQFFLDKLTSKVEAVPFYYISSYSSYIPASDTGQQGQVTAANTTIIKNVVTNISNTVSNISNQITTSTNTITNTITNLQNSISSGLSNLGNTITGNADKNADKITQNNDKNADKITQNNDKNTDKITQNNDKNTDSLKNDWDSGSMDSSNDKLSGALNEMESAESGIMDTVTDNLAKFTYPDLSAVSPGIISACMFFGNFLQNVYTGMADFSLMITLSLTLVFVLILVGYFRYRA